MIIMIFEKNVIIKKIDKIEWYEIGKCVVEKKYRIYLIDFEDKLLYLIFDINIWCCCLF